MSRPRVLSTKAKIRFVDCDPFNHLNNSRYLDYFMNAREDQIEQEYGLNVYKIGQETGRSWVVGTNQIAYLKPVFLMEKVLIESQLIGYSEKNILVEMRMLNESGDTVKALLWSYFVYFDLKTQRSAVHEQKYMDLYKEVYTPLEAKSFEHRLREISKR